MGELIINLWSDLVSVCRKACILWKHPIAERNAGILWKLWDNGWVRSERSESEVNILAASKDSPAEWFMAANAAKVMTGLRWRGVKAVMISLRISERIPQWGPTEYQVPNRHHSEFIPRHHFCNSQILNDLSQLLRQTSHLDTPHMRYHCWRYT